MRGTVPSLIADGDGNKFIETKSAYSARGNNAMVTGIAISDPDYLLLEFSGREGLVFLTLL